MPRHRMPKDPPPELVAKLEAALRAQLPPEDASFDDYEERLFELIQNVKAELLAKRRD